MERAIRGLALGLLSWHKRVTVVIDACGFWSPAGANMVVRQLTAKGITMITTDALTAPSPVQPASPPRRIIYHGRVINRHHPAHAPTAKTTGGKKGSV